MLNYSCFIAWLVGVLVPVALTQAQTRDPETYDVVVYGGTSAGVTAAVEAARMGKHVVLIEPGRHLGGMSSGGLGMTDIGRPDTIGGLADEFYAGIYDYYTKPSSWKYETRVAFMKWMPDNWGVDGKRAEKIKRQFLFEPHAAEQVFNDLLKPTDVRVIYSERLDLKAGVKKDGPRIASIAMESGRTIAGKVFIDATYEGDLLAGAGVSFMLGREPNSRYNETLNGKFPRDMVAIKIDPFVVPGDPSSGLLPPIVHGSKEGKGEGDGLVQAYNFRMCLTSAPQNRVPIAKPATYDPKDYELMARWLQTKQDIVPSTARIGALALAGKNNNIGFNFDLVPNCKTDSNDGSHFGTDLAGASQGWPTGDYATRDKIFARIRDYQLGLIWFLGNDPRVPQAVREQVLLWGLAKDEFADSGNWPFQLYVREARRMVSDYVMTEHDGTGEAVAPDSVAVASYPLDSHSASYFVDDSNQLYREAGFFMPGKAFPISYRSIRPKAAECTNLLVGGCVSATHAAYGSVRMEPVFMMIGQATGAAAALSIDEHATVQDVDYAKLRSVLLDHKAILAAPMRPGDGATKPADGNTD